MTSLLRRFWGPSEPAVTDSNYQEFKDDDDSYQPPNSSNNQSGNQSNNQLHNQPAPSIDRLFNSVEWRPTKKLLNEPVVVIKG